MSSSDSPVQESRRLTRSRDDRIVGGVCAGLARYLDIDPVIPRVVLAVLAVFGGAGLVIYAFAWLLMPEDGTPSTRLERWLEGRHSDRGRDLVIVVIALFVLAFLFDGNHFTHRISGAAVVILLVLSVVALVSRHRPDRFAGRSTYSAPFGTTSTPYGPAPSETTPTEVWSPPPTEPRDRSWLGWLTLAATLLTAGVLFIVAVAGWAHPQPADVLAACVAVVAVGLLVGSVFGRAWSMIGLGVLLVGCLAVANALPRNLTWTAGNRFWNPVTAGPHQPYVLGAGDAQLDLTQLPAHQQTSVVSRIGAGRLVVLVPRGTALDVHATASAGRIEILGHEQDGTSVDVRQTINGSGTDPRLVTLDVQMGFGDVEVRNEAA